MTLDTATNSKSFTLKDLAELLESLPPPDDQYFDNVEEISQNQPALPQSPWES
jgi:hypothetical protein